jgi:hypothetical protein
MTKEQIINKLLTAQQALAEVRAHIPDAQDAAEIGFVLNKLPGIVRRVELRGMLPEERECCGTFANSEHRATCEKYHGQEQV